jgi:hypothetical protein
MVTTSGVHQGMMQSANLAVRFLLELGALAALGFWGIRTGPGLIGKIGLGKGRPS